MKHKWLSALLALALALTILPLRASAQSYDAGDHKDRVVSATIIYMTGAEGKYGSINSRDNGACSIGKLQWHGSRALGLLKRIVNKNPTSAKSILGASLYNEVVNSTEKSWNTRNLTDGEAKKVSALLTTSQGIAAQDELAYIDIGAYYDRGYSLGIRSDAAMMYYCDIENQYGSGNAAKVVGYAKTTLGLSSGSQITSLEQFHKGMVNSSSSLVQNYIARRNKAYAYIKNTLGWYTGANCADCPGAAYWDMPHPDAWDHAGVEFALRNGLFVGTSSTAFSPNTEMSRAMVATVLWRLAGSPAAQGSLPFIDVPSGQWYTSAVLWCYQVGVISGVDDQHFAPNASVTREQLAVMLYNYAKHDKKNTSLTVSLNSYPDKSSVSGYAQTALSWAVASGLINGEVRGSTLSLNPQGCALRSQVACIIQRYAVNAG